MQLTAALKSSLPSGQVAIPGILGGLGPLAHIELERRLLRQRHQRGPVQGDQDYPVWLTINATNVPDRTRSLVDDDTADCIAWLQYYAQLLQHMGSDFLIVPCNTAHAFYGPVQEAIDIPWLHLMEATSQFIQQVYPQVKSVGVLATDGTLQAGLYQQSLKQVGLTAVEPSLNSSLQQQVMQSIYHPNWGIKTTGSYVSPTVLELLAQAIQCLKARGAELIVAGCTELSVACALLRETALPWIDPLDVVADLAITKAYNDPSFVSVAA